jgi:tetratricopeptide (TPR) repeat protein
MSPATNVKTQPAACSCTSGLSSMHCCGMGEIPEPPADRAADMEQQTHVAVHAVQEKKYDEAENILLPLLEEAPGYIYALSTLYQLRSLQGNRRAAFSIIDRMFNILRGAEAGVNTAYKTTGQVTFETAVHPQFKHAMQFLISELQMRATQSFGESRYEEVANDLVRAAGLNPTNPHLHDWLGTALTEIEKLQEGEDHYRRAIALKPQADPLLMARLATNLRLQNRMEEARTLCREANSLAPQDPAVLLFWARIEEADHKLDVAAQLLDRADALSPNNSTINYCRAIVLNRQKRNEEALHLASPDFVAADPAWLQLRGRILDELGRHQEAFDAFLAGKKVAQQKNGRTYDAAVVANLLARQSEFFTAARMEILPRVETRKDVPNPIFILGFPRSGTTMVEQTITGYPHIAAGDELNLVEAIVKSMPSLLGSKQGYPEALLEVPAALAKLRDYYLDEVMRGRFLQPGSRRFTDKTTLNETYLGLIASMFPEAPLLHVVRHPLDVMVSVMSHDIRGKFNFAAGLESTATHYVRVMDSVESLRQQMKLNYLMVRYEDIVAAQEKTMRDITAFIGETFSPTILEFQNNPRRTRTPSYAQVAEKLYSRSAGRFQKYGKQLAPIIPILAPTINRLGYSLDLA